jgi:hypothetical protein
MHRQLRTARRAAGGGKVSAPQQHRTELRPPRKWSTRFAAATFLVMAALAAPATAGAKPRFAVGMLPNSYVTFQVGDHAPQHQRYGYFLRGTWREVKSCRLRATRRGDRVRVKLGNHRLTNPHPFRVWVRCRRGS